MFIRGIGGVEGGDKGNGGFTGGMDSDSGRCGKELKSMPDWWKKAKNKEVPC